MYYDEYPYLEKLSIWTKRLPYIAILRDSMSKLRVVRSYQKLFRQFPTFFFPPSIASGLLGTVICLGIALYAGEGGDRSPLFTEQLNELCLNITTASRRTDQSVRISLILLVKACSFVSGLQLCNVFKAGSPY